MTDTTATANIIVQQEFDMLHETQNIRRELLDALTDAELSFKLPGNPTLGELFVVMGQVQESYISSYKTFKQDWNFKPVAPELAGSVEKLKAWFAQLDADLDAAISALSDDDVEKRMIDRGFPIPPRVQLHVYREGVLIYGGKAVVYFRAMGKPLPKQVGEWIG